MEIRIDSSKKIASIQEEFQKRFPFLKIEFYDKPYVKGEGQAKKHTLNSELTIGEVQKNKLSGTIDINGQMKVEEMESAFSKEFGLSVQVFRKSGTVWLQTSATDDWTLDEQNRRAMEKPDAQDNTAVDPMDYQELE